MFFLVLTHSDVTDKKQATKALLALTKDQDSNVKSSAYYSLGRICVLKATGAESIDNYKKELNNAVEFFEQSSIEKTHYKNPAQFCHPFYKSILSITFEEQKAAAEVQEYLNKAKSTIEGSEIKTLLLDAVENLENALREAHKVKEMGLDAMKSDLKAYKRYRDRASNILALTEEKAPGATKVLISGLPIFDQRIRGILSEIQKNAETLCRQTKDTPFEDLGKELKRAGQNLSLIRDPIALEKHIDNMGGVLTDICEHMSEKGEACRLLEKVMQEPYIEDKLPLITIILSKIPLELYRVRYIENMEQLEKKLDKLMFSLKPGIREDLVITIGPNFFVGGIQHIITIPLQEISYSELAEDLEKIKNNKILKLSNLPFKLAEKVKDYLIRIKKDDLLVKLK